MDLPTDHVNTCTYYGHIYANLIVQRCPHRESYSAHAQAWQDDLDEHPTVLEEHQEIFGPFDDHAYIIRRCSEMVRDVVAAAMAADCSRDGDRIA